MDTKEWFKDWFTSLIFLVALLSNILIYGGLSYIVVHFALKYW